MSGDEVREDVCRHYRSSLEELKSTSKRQITMMSILADKNIKFSKDIVSLIETQIAKASGTETLQLMYLMDSIVKNVGGDYVTAFMKNIVPTFLNVFEKADVNTKKKLYILRTTWNKVFPSKKLYILDVKINKLDRAWPIIPLPQNVTTAGMKVNQESINKANSISPIPIPEKPIVTPTADPQLRDGGRKRARSPCSKPQSPVKRRQLDINTLVSKLLSTGILTLSQSESPSSSHVPSSVPVCHEDDKHTTS